MYIFLDDYRQPNDVKWIELPKVMNWAVVRDYDEFVALLDTLIIAPKFIAFDHDLADAHYNGDFSGPEKTGYDCAKALIQHCLDKNWTVPDYLVHSLNPVGKENIINYLEWAKGKINVGV